MREWIELSYKLKKERKIFAICTVATSAGSTPRKTGAKMIVLPNGSIHGTIGGGQLEKKVIADSLSCIKTGISQPFFYSLCSDNDQCCGGEVEILVEVIGVKDNLYIFGAGHVGHSLVKVLPDSLFNVFLVDERSEWVMSEKIPENIEKCHKSWAKMVEEIKWSSETTWVVIMTYGHVHDFDILANIINRPAKYIGLMGSEHKWRKFQARLKEKSISDEVIKKIRCPIGLDLGGSSPDEISISITAELLKTYYGK